MDKISKSEIGKYADQLRGFRGKFREKDIDFLNISLAKRSDSTYTATYRDVTGQGSSSAEALENLLKLV